MSSIRVDYDILNQKQTPAFYASSLATQPAFGFPGRIFIDTDTPSSGIYRDTGSAWVQVADPGAGTTGTLQQVTTNGSSTTVGLSTSGNGIGIGTTIPASNKLDIHSASGINATFNGTTTNNAALQLQNAGTGKWNIQNLYNAGANSFQVYDVLNSTARLTILNTGDATFSSSIAATSATFSGNVGFGTVLIPSYWVGYIALQIGNDNSIFSNIANGPGSALFISQNIYNDGSNYRYVGTISNEGGLIDLRDGKFTYLNAAAGTVGNIATLTSRLTIENTGAASFSSSVTATALIPSGATIPTNGMYLSAANTLNFATNTTNRLSITSTGVINATSRANFLGSTDNALFSLNSGGTLYTVGFSPNFSTVSSTTYTMTTGATTFLYNGAGIATWTLPNPSGTNQMFWIKNVGTGIITLNAYSGTNIIDNAGVGVSSITIAIGATVLIQQDGNVKSYQLQ